MSDPVLDESYEAGFEAGYRAFRGTMAMLPMTPMEPMTRMNMTPFLMGVRKGIERATGKNPDELIK